MESTHAILWSWQEMAIKLVAEAVSAILVVLGTSATCQGECSFRFKYQPRTGLDCNPYHGSQLHITCLAIGPLDSGVEVAWFHRSLIDNGTSSTVAPQKVDLGSSSYSVIETRVDNSLSGEQLISSILIVENIEKVEGSSLCIWCQIKAPGRALEDPSNRLCIRAPEAYTHLRNCSSQEVVLNTSTVCVQEKRIGCTASKAADDSTLTTTHTLTPAAAAAPTQAVASNAANTGPGLGAASELATVAELVLSTPQLCVLSSVSMTSLPVISSTTSLDNAYTSMYDGPPTIYRVPGSRPFMQPPLTASAPHLLPSPTKGTADNSSNNSTAMMHGNSNLMALYTAVVVCALLAAIIIVLVAVVLVLCRRRSMRRRKSKLAAGLQSSSPPKSVSNSPKVFQYQSRFSPSGSEGLAGEGRGEGGGGGYLPYLGTGDIRYGSETEALRGSIDTRTSGSREASMSTEKSSSLSRKNSAHSAHKYAEIDTISAGERMSHIRHASLGDNIHQGSNGNGSIPGATKLIPPPPNTRGRSKSTPHFYYILEKLECEAEEDKERSRERNKLRGPRDVVGSREGSSKKSRSREGSAKNRAGSLKRELGSKDASLKSSELCWGDGSVRSRTGSFPSKERRGGSLKRVVISREGSSMSSRSREGSVKNATTSTEGSVRVAAGSREGSVRVAAGSREGSVRVAAGSREGSVRVAAGSREGSVKSRGSRDDSFKKEVWVPVREESAAREKSGMSRKIERVPPPPRDYDVLMPSHVSVPYSYVNDNYVEERDHNDEDAIIFDDPKYAAVNVGDLPRLVNRHQSLDPIIPRRMRNGRGVMGTESAVSSKSLQDAGLTAGSAVGGGMRTSIYDATPSRESGMTGGSGGITPSRLSMPLDSYYS